MKRILLLLFILPISMGIWAQKALFDRFEDTDEVTAVYLSHSMLQMVGSMKVGNKDIHSIAKRLDYLRILSCEHAATISVIKKAALDIYRQQRYHVAMQMKDSGETVIIYQKDYSKGKHEYSLLSIEKGELSVINILGNVTLQDIQGIAGK